MSVGQPAMIGSGAPTPVEPEIEGTTPMEFLLWLNGASALIGEQPTPEQWDVIKEKMAEALSFVVKKRFLLKAEEQVQTEAAAWKARLWSEMRAKQAQMVMDSKRAAMEAYRHEFDSTRFLIGAPPNSYSGPYTGPYMGPPIVGSLKK